MPGALGHRSTGSTSATGRSRARPGFLTPQTDLDLESVPLVVPERYARAALAGRELMVSPGFAVNVFAAGTPLEGPRFMARDPEGVLHVANMKTGGGEELAR